MKANKWIVGVIVLSLITLYGQHYAIAKKGGNGNGTSILHLTVDVTMTGTGVDPDAAGSAQADHKKQGNSNQQDLDISLANLNPNTTYDLMVVVGDNTNLVTQFTTDAGGAAVFNYVQKNTGKASPHGDPLPNELDPVSSILALQVVNASTQTVLNADFTVPDKLQYLVKRNMTNDGVDNDAAASLRIKSNGSSVQFRLRASGLDASATYFLAINGSIAETETTDANGGLNLTSLPGGAPDVLDITSLAIWNVSSNSVLSTTLP